MHSQTLLIVFSNVTHLETYLHYHSALVKGGYVIEAIIDLSRKEYSKGLVELLDSNRSCFKKVYKVTIGLKLSRLYDEYYFNKRLQKILKKTNKVITFTEGGVTEWIVLGMAKKLGRQSFCIQWAITWRPEVYNLIHGKDLSVSTFKTKFISAIRKIIGCGYRRMIYLGDGGAGKLLTMGEYWTNQFLDAHSRFANKFVTLGNLRLVGQGPFNKNKVVLLTLGASNGLYGVSLSKHLKRIEAIYEQFNLSKLINNGYVLEHKIHPRDPSFESVKRLASRFRCVEVLSPDHDLKSTLQYSKLVITVRSTVGFEALLNNCNVLVIDDGYEDLGFDYASNGLASKVTDVKNIADFLNLYEWHSVPEIEYYLKTKNVNEDLLEVLAGGMND